jgi:hypothetical protein
MLKAEEDITQCTPDGPGLEARLLELLDDAYGFFGELKLREVHGP